MVEEGQIVKVAFAVGIAVEIGLLRLLGLIANVKQKWGWGWQ
jgi:hypothetical protein